MGRNKGKGDQGNGWRREWALPKITAGTFVGVFSALIVLFIIFVVTQLFRSNEDVDDVNEKTSTTSMTTQVGPMSEELDACNTASGVQWVQVESSSTDRTDWIVERFTGDEKDLIGFCDGSALFPAKPFYRVMIDEPLSTAEFEDLDDVEPTRRLAPICELRRRMRIAGGELPVTAVEVPSHFSDFWIGPSGQSIGPNRCWPFLDTDPEYGSRAAVDRFFGILSSVAEGQIKEPKAIERLSEVATPAFIEKSHGIPEILKHWENCREVRVKWVSSPLQIRGLDSIKVQMECPESTGKGEKKQLTRDYTLGVTPTGPTPGAWQVHWDMDKWGNPAPF